MICCARGRRFEDRTCPTRASSCGRPPVRVRRSVGLQEIVPSRIMAGNASSGALGCCPAATVLVATAHKTRSIFRRSYESRSLIPDEEPGEPKLRELEPHQPILADTRRLPTSSLAQVVSYRQHAGHRFHRGEGYVIGFHCENRKAAHRSALSRYSQSRGSRQQRLVADRLPQRDPTVRQRSDIRVRKA
jgi:hypothetical protein